MLNGEIPFQPNPQKAELEAPEAPHTGSITSFKRYFNTENRKAFVVGLFKPGTQVVEEKEKLPLISWFRLFLCTAHATSLMRHTSQPFLRFSWWPVRKFKEGRVPSTLYSLMVTARGLGSEVVATILT